MTTSVGPLSVYATIYEPGDVSVVADGNVTVLDHNPDTPPATSWAAVWYEDETYADSCHTSSPDVSVVHYDWSLWNADLNLNVGRIDDFNPIEFALDVAADVASLGPRGRASLLEDATEFLDSVERSFAYDAADPRGNKTLHACAKQILAGNAEPSDPAPELEVDSAVVALVLPGGTVAATITGLTETEATFEVVHAHADELPAVTVPRSLIRRVFAGPLTFGEDGLLHYEGDECSCRHEVLTHPEDPAHQMLSCGRDFMGGTICSLVAGHIGPDGTTCPWCAGDWYMGTCECPTDDEDLEG